MANVAPLIVVGPPYTVEQAIGACGVLNAGQYQGFTDAERIAADVFDDDFASCMDKTHGELDDDFKTYQDLAANAGRIRLDPAAKKNIKAFVQWTKDEIRQGRDPALTVFPVNEAVALIRRHKSHESYVKKSKTLTETAKPEKFTAKVKWEDWAPAFLNFLRSIPGRDGVPLKYVCRDNDLPDQQLHADFLDDYVSRAPHAGQAFATDAAEVHTYIVNFIAGNQTAESKIQAHAQQANGRLDFIALKEHYEGVGINAIDVVYAEKILDTLFYLGEKRPHMWWEEFERQLTSAFTTIDRKEQRQVHSTDMKLRILTKKVNADFLQHIKAAISLEMTRTPMTLTYEQALANFRNEVNRKFAPELGGLARTRRTINETSRYNNRSGQNNRGGRGGGRGGGRHTSSGGRNGNNKRTRNDSTFITLTDNSTIEYHPSFNFPPHIFAKMKEEDKAMMRQQRADYKSQRSRQVQQTTTYQPPPMPQLPVNVPASQTASHISQITQNTHAQPTHSTIMGGRNEQASQRSNRHVAPVSSCHRHVTISSATQIHAEPNANISANNETDNNADTSCLGTNFVIYKHTGRSADVYPYDKSYQPLLNVPIVTGATAYDDKATNTTYILLFHKLYIMEPNLIIASLIQIKSGIVASLIMTTPLTQSIDQALNRWTIFVSHYTPAAQKSISHHVRLLHKN